jgi:hypothetical protein
MELTREEQTFFEAGEAIDDQTPEEAAALGRHRSRRRRRRSVTRRVNRRLRSLRSSGWGKIFLSLVLTVAAVAAGYRASMYVINRDLPSPSELGVEARGR